MAAGFMSNAAVLMYLCHEAGASLMILCKIKKKQDHDRQLEA
jgi:hypothetical protein